MAWPVLKINDVTAENMRAEIDARGATVQTLHCNYRTETNITLIEFFLLTSLLIQFCVPELLD